MTGHCFKHNPKQSVKFNMDSVKFEYFLLNFTKVLYSKNIFKIRLDSYKSLDCEMLAEIDTAHFTSPPMFVDRVGDLTYLSRLLTYYHF